MNRLPWRACVAGLVGFAIAFAFSHGRSTPYNNYVLFADALLHGRIWIAWPGPSIDAVLFEGHRYIVNDPLPGVLMLPLVAIWHLWANQTIMACVLAGIATGAAWQLARNLGAGEWDAGWLTAFMLLGTDLMWCAMLGDVWYIAHVACLAFLLLALCELSGRGRAWLVALYFALACASRFTVVVTLPIFCFWLTRGFAVEKQDRRALVAAGLTWLPFAALWIAYNEVRWHVPWDSGHTIFFHQDTNVGSVVGSPFALINLPYELWSFFVQGLEVSGDAPYLVPPQTGVALTWTSPALLLACFARRPLQLVVSSWAATVLAAIPSLVYYTNGTEQFGMRHALDFEAFLFVLMAVAARRGLHTIWRALIAFSAGLGLWGAWFWDAFYRSWM